MNAFARAAARLQEFRQSRCETRVLPRWCAHSGKPYAVVFERCAGEELFTVVEIVKGEAGRGKTQKLEDFAVGEFDFSDEACPWCGDASGTIKCGRCGECVCGGRARRTADGTRVFACHPACGNVGTTVSASHVSGSGGARRQTALPARPQRQMISDASALLTGPRK